MTKAIADDIARFENLPEKQDKTFQRELVERGQRLAQESQAHLAKTGEYRGIFGLLSVDRELDRSFSANPLKDLFAIDRKRFPIGTAFYNPRQFIYYIAPAEPTGKWRLVISLIEDRVLEEFKNKPGEIINKISDRLRIDQKTSRQPDWLKIELEISDEFALYIKSNNFRCLPFDLVKTFKGKFASAARSQLKGIPIISAHLFGDIEKIIVGSVDWNGPLSPSKFAEHILKHRNTVAAGMNKVFSTFRITLAAKGELLFSMRDILVDNEEMISIVQMAEGPRTMETDRLMGAGVKTAEELRQVQETLQKVRETRTFFKQPVTYVTFRFRAVIEARSGAIRFVGRVPVQLPPAARIKVQTQAGVTEEIVLEEFLYQKRLEPIIGELEHIATSIEKIFPARLTKWLTRVR
jgi:hypothetical protein